MPINYSKKILLFFALTLILFLYFYLNLFENGEDVKIPQKLETKIPTNSKMKTTKKFHEKITNLSIVYILDTPARLSEYKIAMGSMKCYTQRHQHYSMFVLYTPPVENETGLACSQRDFFFRRHCFIADWMAEHAEIEWLLILDGDVGVVNPNHMIEEYINEGNELIFFDRIFNNEIMAGGYLAKNTHFTRDFLNFWANYYYRLPKSFHGTDNGAIHAVFMEKYVDESKRNNCQYLWEKSKNFADLNIFTVCTRHFIDFKMAPDRTFDNGRIKVFPKGKCWMREGCHTGTHFSRRDFMFHDWKQSTLDKFTFFPWTNPFDPSLNFGDAQFCASGADWRYKPEFVEQPEHLIEQQLQQKIKEVDDERVGILKDLKLYKE